eukprot:243630-Chlamydomonas_euryale.AAC.2
MGCQPQFSPLPPPSFPLVCARVVARALPSPACRAVLRGRSTRRGGRTGRQQAILSSLSQRAVRLSGLAQ